MHALASKRVLGVFTLTMINVAAIQSLRNLPVMARVGWASLFFYAVAALGFFIPSALVSAELATGWPSTGGVYTWVKEAFGARWGFVAIWLQWIENVIWYPTILAFTAVTIAYIFDPKLADNSYYVLWTVLGTYWICTFIDSLGMRASGRVSTAGVIFGTLTPAGLIIFLGAIWLFKGNPSRIPFSLGDLFPELGNLPNVVFLVGVMLGLAGMEMSAVHAKEVENPQKDYPRAIFYSAILILAISVLGSLAIAIVVPARDMSIVAGVMQAFTNFFEAYKMPWMTSIVATMISAGAIGSVSTWIVGPSKGLYQTAHEGHLPPFFHKKNRSGMPMRIMAIQGVIVSLLCSLFLLMPNVSSSYWILTDLTALLYLMMYLLLFAAGIKLRYSQPNVKRAYRIPGGERWGMVAVAGLGFAASSIAFFIGFIPPAQLETGEKGMFQGFLVLGVAIFFFLPLLIYAFQKNHWKIDE